MAGVSARAVIVTMLDWATGSASTSSSSAWAETGSPSWALTLAATVVDAISRAAVSTSRVGSLDSSGKPSPI